MLLLVHDELVVLASEECEAVEPIGGDSLANADELREPLDDSIGLGAYWQMADH